MSTDVGLQGEALALDYLEKRGFHCLQKNYRSKVGEIDLIMRDGEYLVFVEVKYRKLLSPEPFAATLESITPSKQSKLRRTALLYLQTENLMDKIPCRFDVVAMTEYQGKTTMEWVENAF